ncbi:MAG: ATP-binding protein [Leptospiraceae bacterium]|nr:ATP-binding protein [Leptospiraceae bacterium]MCP5502735.1 ATP-binding protein [Leptospiraceae bacterium]
MPSSPDDKLQELVSSVKHSIEKSAKKKVKRKVSFIFRKLGNPRRNKKIIEQVNKTFLEEEIRLEPGLSINDDLDSYVEFQSIATKQENEKDSKQKEEIFVVPDDFIKYLFTFSSEAEYERFQAALDSYQPVGLFLIPKEEDFFSETMEQIFSIELLQKRQYSGDDMFVNELTYLDVSFTGDNTDTTNEGNKNEGKDIWTSSEIYHFPRTIMQNVILGETGTELLDSYNFEMNLQRLSHTSNKHSKTQIFILFHCPSQKQIQKLQKQDILEKTLSSIARRIPNVFRLDCKYEKESDIEEEVRNNVYKHLKLIYDLPGHEIDTELNLIEFVTELRRTHARLEYQTLLKMETEYIKSMVWDGESDEHVYLKYFTIKYLCEKLGYSQKDVFCSSYDSPHYQNQDEYVDYSNMPDVNAKHQIVVDIETLEGKNFDKNVYLNFIHTLVNKSRSWVDFSVLKKNLKEIYLLFPGFEVARNYYQLSKLQEVLENHIREVFKKNIPITIFTPDYENQTIVPVDLKQVVSQNYKPVLPIQLRFEEEKKRDITELNFDDVIGMKEEKEAFLNLKKLQESNMKLGIGGILLYGLPGCGKTYIARAFASEINRHFFGLNPAEIISVWIGQSQKNISRIFSQARAKSPSLLFIDELDSIGFNRDMVNKGGAHTDQGSTINQLLIELNNIDEKDVLVLAATNRLSSLDPALKRSGRFDIKIPVFPPDEEERALMFAYYIVKINEELITHDKKPVPQHELFFEELGRDSKGFTSSDIRTVCNLVRMDCLLEKPGSHVNEFFFDKIRKFIERGQRTLRAEDVKGFILECRANEYDGLKLDKLTSDWF